MTCFWWQTLSQLVAQTFLSVRKKLPMQDHELHKKRRNLPHWTMEDSIYYVTFRSITTPFTNAERKIILNHLLSGNPQFYTLFAAVLMPDHAHLLLKPQPGFSLSRIMKGIKGVSANLINQHRQTTGQHVWQDESWDRIIRDAEEFQEKFEYMANNPIRAGLVKLLEEYTGWFCDVSLL